MENTAIIELLLNEVQTISQSYDRVAEATGEKFNIFSILQMESDEVATHSRFLAELLNPKGRHGQGDNFLALFLYAFVPELELNPSKCNVTVEFHIGFVNQKDIDGGRIDILISEDNNQKVLMIENKIYAGEQENQLLRYSKAFDKLTETNKKILFLTLDGKSSEQKKSEDLYKNNILKDISYERDIINWLEDCKKEAVNIPILRETISQYINLIKKLTNQNLNKKMSQDIVKRILLDGNSFKAFNDLYNSKETIIKAILNEEVLPILKELGKEKHKLTFDGNNEKFLNGKKGPENSFYYENDILKAKNLKIGFYFFSSGYVKLLIGLKFIDEENKQNSIPKEKFKSLNPDNSAPKDWLWEKTLSKFNNWSDLKNWEQREQSEQKHKDFKEYLESNINDILAIVENKTI